MISSYIHPESVMVTFFFKDASNSNLQTISSLSIVNGHLGWFSILILLHSVARNTNGQVSLSTEHLKVRHSLHASGIKDGTFKICKGVMLSSQITNKIY